MLELDIPRTLNAPAAALGSVLILQPHNLQISGANPKGAAAKAAGWHAMIASSPAERLHVRLTGTLTQVRPVVSNLFVSTRGARAGTLLSRCCSSAARNAEQS